MHSTHRRARLPGEVDLRDRYPEAGLPAPSIIRTAKIATIESAHADHLGRLGEDLLEQLLDQVGSAIHSR